MNMIALLTRKEELAVEKKSKKSETFIKKFTISWLYYLDSSEFVISEKIHKIYKIQMFQLISVETIVKCCFVFPIYNDNLQK